MQCLAVPPSIVDLKLVTCPSLPACTLNQKRKLAINTGQLAYTFIKLGDNLTNNDRDILTDIKHIALSASLPSGLNYNEQL